MAWEPTDEGLRAFRERCGFTLNTWADEALETAIRAAWAVSPGPGLADALRECESLLAEQEQHDGCEREYVRAGRRRLLKEVRAALAPLRGEPAPDPRDEVVAAARQVLARYGATPGSTVYTVLKREMDALRDALAKAQEVRGE